MARLLKLPRNRCPVVWIRIPKDRWPKWWHEKGLVDLVVPLLVNLYGHPLAGLLWEKHLEEKLVQSGWKKLHSWECIYYHSKDQISLNAYVDDLKMVGKAENIKPMWESLRKVLDLDPETDLVDHVYLGCTQINHKPPREVVESKQKFFAQLMSKKGSEPKEGGDIDLLSLAYAFSGWNMPPETAGGSKPEETYVHPSVLNPTLTKDDYDKIKGWGLDMTGHAEQCVQRYCELTGANPKNFKKFATPCMDDHQFTGPEMQGKGKLSDVAARAVLKCLYLASVARPDILWTVNLLARSATKWIKACVRRT